jgi:UDP-N-acetylglucosamine 4,6-dehydratase
VQQFAAAHGATTVADEFRYSSGRNTDWLTVDALRRLIVEHVDSSFKV